MRLHAHRAEDHRNLFRLELVEVCPNRPRALRVVRAVEKNRRVAPRVQLKSSRVLRGFETFDDVPARDLKAFVRERFGEADCDGGVYKLVTTAKRQTHARVFVSLRAKSDEKATVVACTLDFNVAHRAPRLDAALAAAREDDFFGLPFLRRDDGADAGPYDGRPLRGDRGERGGE